MFIGYWPYATFYSGAPYRNLTIKLEPWIITAGLSVQISNCKNYMGMETRLYCATRAHCIASPPKSTESKWAVLPPVLHRIPQGNHAASGQCWELGYDRAGRRCSVSLPQASLFGNSLVWTFLDCKYVQGYVFFRVRRLCMLFHVCMDFYKNCRWNGKRFCVYALFSHIKYPEVQ